MKRRGMPRDLGARIAYAGIGGAISLVFVTLSYYVDMLTIAFQACAALGVMVPLAKKYYREAAIMVAAVSGISFFIVNLSCLLFLFVSGGFTVATIFLSEKKVPYWITLIGKLVYANLVFLLFYKGVSLIGLDFDRLATIINVDALTPAWLYVILDVICCFALIVWDWAVLFSYKYLERFVPGAK